MPNKTFIRLDEDKKERVMRAAIEAFVKDGFEKTKVDVIAANAGISKGSIYQYFVTKKNCSFTALPGRWHILWTASTDRRRWRIWIFSIICSPAHMSVIS